MSEVLRSSVRVKAAALFGGFVVCLICLRLGLWSQAVLFGIAAVCAVGVYFVRCEQCKSSIYFVTGGSRRFPAGPSAYRFLLSASCPYCGRPRL